MATVAELAIRGPMVAVGREADPPPRRSLAPLIAVAEAYARAGAEVHNLPQREAKEAAA